MSITLSTNDSRDSDRALVTSLESLAVSRPGQTLLPSRLASAVSFLTATSSLSLRLGSAVGNLAISLGRITTLTGFELTRNVLEGILARAGQDVAQSTRSHMGRTAAEGILEKALIALHQAITTSSFLVSAGFQIGSTGISTSLAVGQTLLSALDALFGDTETSKAIATIIVLVQREVAGTSIAHNGESVSLSDLFTSVVAFALLQRWGYRRTQLENERTGSTEIIWDLVVLTDSQRDTTASTDDDDDDEGILAVQSSQEDAPRPRPRSSASFMSALGDGNDFQGTSLDDAHSFMSNTSARALRDLHADEAIEPAIKDHIVSQLRHDSKVKITVQSMSVSYITVELDTEDDVANLRSPPGYTLVANEETTSKGRKLIFQGQARKRKMGVYDAHRPLPSRRSSRNLDDVIPLNLRLTRDSTLTNPSVTLSSDDSVENVPILANQKRQRTVPTSAVSEQPSLLSRSASFLPASPPIAQRLSKVRDTIRQKRSYQNLVDFWNGNQNKRQSEPKDRTPQITLNARSVPRPPSRPVSPRGLREKSYSYQRLHPLTRSSSVVKLTDTQDSSHYSLPTEENFAAFDEHHSNTYEGHRRHHHRAASVYSVVSAASETSLVLHTDPYKENHDSLIASLHRDGCLPGQWPAGPFAVNALRYLQFSIASYGQSFLRILGTVSQDHARHSDPNSADPREHHAFSSYTRLPPSTVLLSSYVDPQGVPISKNQPGAATVLVHYVSLDHDAKTVVLTCRGTLGVEDILTDLTADYDDFIWQNETHQAHQGILAAARKLLYSYNGRVMATLANALEEFSDYGLVLCGHSLGGSVASVLAMLLSEYQEGSDGEIGKFVTRTSSGQRLISPGAAHEGFHRSNAKMLPPGRPIHVYAYGPAAAVSPSLQKATRGLITSIIHGQDSVSYLSLGTLRDFRSIALAFRVDQGQVKNEIRRRLWESLQNVFRERSGVHDQWLPSDALSEDQWPWLALQGLRSNLDAVKLLPPGNVFHIESKPVLQRHFVSTKSEGPKEAQTYRPAQHVTLTYVRDVESKFREITFGPSMWFDHMPMRYEAVLETLEKGLA